MRDIIKKHPLAAVLLLASALRIVAAVYSQGFIQSDDFYDTVEVSYDWLRNGLWGEDGHLHWKEHPATSVVRFPLYTLFLYLIMKLHYLLGITALDRMMYVVRFVHALIALLPVWAIFEIVRMVTRDARWALWAALLPALHFAMPFLGVRNLIEMVGGNLWIVAIYFIYCYQNDRRITDLYLAGAITGLAWMIRFQLAFAVLPIPFVLWYDSSDIKPALHYSLAVAIMLILSAFADKLLLGYWGASTINNLILNTGLGTVYKTIPLMYPLVILAFFIPPLSFLMVYLFFAKSFWRQHRILIVSTLSFMIFHLAHPNQQERFMISIIPPLMLMGALAFWHRFHDRGYIVKSNTALRSIMSISLVINFLLLIPFTFAYGHKGLVEPLIWLERIKVRPKVLFVQPGMHRWIPEAYAGYDPLPNTYIRDWSDLELIRGNRNRAPDFDYMLLYPKNENQLTEYVDSLQNYIGPIARLRIFEPSLYDRIFYFLNPDHYRTYRAYVYRSLP